MTVATWNVERLKHGRELDEILLLCEKAEADILVLTETDERVRPGGYRHCFRTACLAEISPGLYRPTENRVSVFTNYACLCRHVTYDRYAALCVELETELGRLCVYGTVIGAEGNRRPSFKTDVLGQVGDFSGLAGAGKKLCIAGDFNISFSDGYYFTKFGRDTLARAFAENGIRILTENVPECIDHIAVSEDIAEGMAVNIREWNIEKRLSDHKGIAAEITKK